MHISRRAVLASAAAVRSATAATSGFFDRLDPWIRSELTTWNIPGFGIVVVNGGEVTFRCWGSLDPAQPLRVGSVSKVFTGLALLPLNLDLDAPVDRYLPDFRPRNPFGAPITLRQLLCHRSGLVREPPVGHYFDAASPPLADSVRSLNDTELVYAPGSRTKYSNAGVAVVGRVIERHTGRAFAEHIRRAVLEPLGMSSSGYRRPEGASSGKALLWTYDGREFPAPEFALWEPAGNLYAPLADLGRFLRFLLGDGAPLLRPDVFREMQRPQLGGQAFGLGLLLSQLDGHAVIGHNGAVYGYATEVMALPQLHLGVAAVATRDSANAWIRRVCEHVARSMLAARAGQRMPAPLWHAPVPLETARRLEGRYGAGREGVELRERGGRLFLLPLRGGQRVELRAAGPELVACDPLGSGTRYREGSGVLAQRVADARPAACPDAWRPLLGEYGWDHNVLYILERDGRLNALMEWFDYYPLEPAGDGVFRLPDFGMYHGETLRFEEAAANLGGLRFPRRPVGPEGENRFQITPLRPVEELRAEALAARPPQEKGRFRRSELVSLSALDPAIRLAIHYATSTNFLGVPVYTQARAFLQRPAAQALLRAHRKLMAMGYGVLIHDAYRPWAVTKIFWEATPPDKRDFVANPAEGSRHNRGCAVDLTLYDLASGRPVEMPGVYDEMSPRSYPDYPGGTSAQRWHRDLLRRAMEDEGFRVFHIEWWHFDYRDWRHYAIENRPFEQIPER